VVSLRKLELFADLSDEALGALAQGARVLLYETGETVVRQGQHGEELYLCLQGELSVLHAPAGMGSGREVATLEPGGVFGELSLLTGAPRSASVVAKTQCELLTIGKSALAPVLATQPALAERLSARLAERQAELGALALVEQTADRSTLEEQQGQLLKRIRQFFSLR
jgi:CRP-like cAMP-binding protein